MWPKSLRGLRGRWLHFRHIPPHRDIGNSWDHLLRTRLNFMATKDIPRRRRKRCRKRAIYDFLSSHSTRPSFNRVSLAEPDDGAVVFPVLTMTSVFFCVSQSVVPSIRIWDFDTPPAIKFGDPATIG